MKYQNSATNYSHRYRYLKVVAVRFQVRYFSEEDIRSNSRQALIVCEIHL